jgi:lipoate-protein ligase A
MFIINVSGLNSVLRNRTAIEQKIFEATKEGIEDSAFDLENKASQLAPLDTGDLRGSSKTDIEVSGKKVEGKVSFNEPYALDQHEDLQFNHPRGGQAKYLEQPLKENEQDYKRHVERKVRQVTR